MMLSIRTRQLPALFAIAVLATSILLPGSGVLAQAPASNESVRSFITQNSMNIFRRFPAEQRDKMLEYYGKVLALRSLSPVSLGGGNQMILYGVGSGQVKLASGLVARREFRPGPVKDATGLRVITLFFPDEAALVARFKEFGYAAPEFRDGANGARHAMVADPGGFMTELVVVKNSASPSRISTRAARSIGSLSASTSCRP
jgi:hypothetical protein